MYENGLLHLMSEFILLILRLYSRVNDSLSLNPVCTSATIDSGPYERLSPTTIW